MPRPAIYLPIGMHSSTSTTVTGFIGITLEDMGDMEVPLLERA
jgi:hypothetical protein